MNIQLWGKIEIFEESEKIHSWGFFTELKKKSLIGNINSLNFFGKKEQK